MSEKKPAGNMRKVRGTKDSGLRKLVHELQARQTELEKQNKELRSARIRFEESCSKYFDLYDLAPVGYFTFDENGLILEVNLTGAEQLGRERSSLIKMPFSMFICKDDRDIFYHHRQQVFERKTQCDCEIRLKRNGESEFYAQIVSITAPDSQGNFKQIRSTLKDISERKLIEDALVWESNVNSAIAALSSALISKVSLDEIGHIVLHHAKHLTGSAYGYVGYIEQQTGYMINSTSTRDIWDECRVPEKDVVFKKFHGLWGWVLNNREPLLTNSPVQDPRSSGTPPGHIPIERFLSVPALIGDTLLGQVSLANPPGDYTDRDLDLVKRLAALYAIAVNSWRHRQALEDSEAKYRDLVDNSLVGVFKTNIRGEILYVNEAAVEIFECDSIEEAISEGALARYKNHKDRERFIEDLTRSGRVDHYEIEMLTSKGNTRNALVSARLDGDIVSGMLMDITERKRMEMELSEHRERLQELVERRTIELYESEERYRRITGAITDYIYTVRVEAGRPVETTHSEACFAVTGYTREEFYSDPYLWIRIVPEEEHHLVRNQVEQVLSGHFPKPIEHRIVRKDGVICWVESNIVPYKDVSGGIISYDGIVRDITERKSLEAQLLHGQKMESIGALAGGVAHDFNNILTVITSIVSILRRKMPENDPLKMYVEEIQAAVQDAANLTKDLLVFSRKQRLQPESTDFNEVIRKLENFLLRIIGEDIELRIIFADESLPVMVDFSQMEQVMMNLFANARDAMPEGGSLTVRMKSEEIDNEFVQSHGYGVPGRYAVISVSDTGTGMDESSMQKIFEPFFSTKEVGKGTGLGMSIAYGIIKQHKGYITVESGRDKGSTFRIYLPLIEWPAAEDKRVTSPTEPVRGTETVLIAEDDAKIRRLITSYLSDLGYRTIAAKDGEDAVRKFIKNKDRIDVIVSDVIMPKKSGKEVYEEIKEIKPDARILFLSGYSAEIIRLKDIIESGIEIIPKPILLDELVGKIRKELDKDL